MKELKYQRNAFIILTATAVVIFAAFIVDTITNGFYWPSIAAVLFVILSTVERYEKYKFLKIKLSKSVEN